MTADDVEHMCRTVVLHCLRALSNGDERVKEFCWELISIQHHEEDESKEGIVLTKTLF